MNKLCRTIMIWPILCGMIFILPFTVNAQDDVQQKLESSLRLLSIREKTLGDDNPANTELLKTIATYYYRLNNIDSAIQYFHKSLDIIDKVHGKVNIDYADILNKIGLCYWQLGSFSQSLDYHQKALIILDQIYGEDAMECVPTIITIGNCLLSTGDYRQALEYFNRSVTLLNQAKGEKSAYYATCLNNIGLCQLHMGNFSSALDAHQRALEIREELLGRWHPEYAQSLINMAQCYSFVGDFDMAIDNLRSALAVYESHGELSSDLATCLNNIGVCYWQKGDYSEALDYHRSAYEMRERLYGDIYHPDYAMSLTNIGLCYTSLGDYDSAIEYQKKALDIYEKSLGEIHPNRWAALINLGASYMENKDYKNALDCFLRSKMVQDESLVDNSQQSVYATCLNNIGMCYWQMGDYSLSLEFNERARELREMIFGETHPDYAMSLTNIGLCYSFMGDHFNAIESQKKALDILERFYGERHPEYFDKLIGICLDYLAIGDLSSWQYYMFKYINIVISMIPTLLPFLQEQQRCLLWDKYDNFFTNYVFLCTADTDMVSMHKLSYNCALFGKGLLLNSEIEIRKAILESGDAETVQIFNEIQAERAHLDKLYENPEGRKAEIDSLRADLEKRQMELARRSKAFGDYTRNLTIKWEDVRDALAKDDIAIEFASYTSADTTYYIALTLKEDYDAPHLVKLFTDKDISNPQGNWYSLPSSTEKVWGNLKGELDGVQNVYFSPVGELNNIAIEYLPEADGNNQISDNRNYYRLSSTRELVKEHGTERLTDAVVFGGISYDITPKSKLKGDESTSQLLSMTADRQYMSLDSLRLERSGWKYLPGTKKEADAINGALAKMKVSTTLLEGEDATEESFKALAGAKKKLIHIATHGFYYTETDARRLDDMRFMLTDESMAPKEDKMLTRSGLLFAGAANTFEGKKVPKDVEDGIVTARDISRMDLRGTDLVVLSACQSGLGDIAGDGVYGLQRGFKKAGVQTIVMSLWKVDDVATRIMMTRFYDNILRGKDKHTAFTEAKNHLRKYDKGKYDDPYYYAAFIILDAIGN